MSARSVNKVILIGNLTRDPELRYTPQGTPVASFGIATNREWTVDGVKKEAADFHNIVAWNKLGELCSQLLAKGSKVYVEGRLQTRDWVDAEGSKRYKTEVVIDEMIVLVSKKDGDDDYEMDSPSSEMSDSDDNGPDMDDDDIDLDKVLSEVSEDLDSSTDDEEDN